MSNKLGKQLQNGFIPFEESEKSARGERVVVVRDVFGLKVGEDTGTIMESGSNMPLVRFDRKIGSDNLSAAVEMRSLAPISIEQKDLISDTYYVNSDEDTIFKTVQAGTSAGSYGIRISAEVFIKSNTVGFFGNPSYRTAEPDEIEWLKHCYTIGRFISKKEKERIKKDDPYTIEKFYQGKPFDVNIGDWLIFNGTGGAILTRNLREEGYSDIITGVPVEVFSLTNTFRGEGDCNAHVLDKEGRKYLVRISSVDGYQRNRYEQYFYKIHFDKQEVPVKLESQKQEELKGNPKTFGPEESKGKRKYLVIC